MNFNINAVIFDLDGTLIDSMALWEDVDKNFLSKRNIDFPDDLFDNLKSNGINDLAVYFKNRFSLKESIEEIIKEWIDEVNLAYSYTLKIKTGSLDLIKYFKSKELKLAIGTSNELSLTRAVLQSNNILDYFETISTGCGKIKGKPAPDIYLQAAKNINIKPENCLVIEDSLQGVLAAKNAKMKVFAIEDNYSAFEKDEILSNADSYFTCYSEMFDYIKKII